MQCNQPIWGGPTILTVFGKEDRKAWDAYVRTFHNWDVYYLYEYAYSFMLHGDGDIHLICFENDAERFCYVVMQNDISDAPQFKNLLRKETWYDWETPYGYGGPLTDGAISENSQNIFLSEIEEYCCAHHIISQFIRFHPLLRNYEVLPAVIETRYLRDTIFIDTTSQEVIMQNMDSKNRNMVRKAQKNGVTIERSPICEFSDFISMYDETMEKNGADDYYTFDEKYFESLNALSENACILYAMLDGKPIAGAIIFYNDRFMHYHLSGSRTAFRKYAPSNMLLFDAACRASEMGISQFHLGGGMAPEDSLFGFKKQFNKIGRASFVVGRTIFNEEAYHMLLNERKRADPNFNIDNGFMIQYRR